MVPAGGPGELLETPGIGITITWSLDVAADRRRTDDIVAVGASHPCDHSSRAKS